MEATVEIDEAEISRLLKQHLSKDLLFVSLVHAYSETPRHLREKAVEEIASRAVSFVTGIDR